MHHTTDRFLQQRDKNLKNIQDYLDIFNEQQNDDPQVTNEILKTYFRVMKNIKIKL